MDKEEKTVTERYWDEELTNNAALNHNAQCRDCIFRDKTEVGGVEYGWQKSFCHIYGKVTLSRLKQLDIDYVPANSEDKPPGVYDDTEVCEYYEKEARLKR